jgi:UDP-N-acetylglucosamine 3-dehydrogenase
LNNQKLSFAVLGCGVWGRNHIRVLSEMKNIDLTCISDISEETVFSLAEKYRIDYTTDPEIVLNNKNIDTISICTPTITHFDLAKKALESGKNVLVEKPMTNTVEEAKELIHLAKKHDSKLAVGFIERFNPAIQEAVKIVQAGTIGEVILAHTKRVSRWPQRIGDVGVIKDLAIHDIDIVNQLFGIEAGTVFTNAGNIRHSFEDYANIMMCFPDHKGAFIETNWLTPRKVRTLSVTGTEGIVNVEFITQTVSIENDKQIVQPFIGDGEPLRLELEAFRDAIINDTEPIVTGEDGLKALKVCESAIESARTGEPVINNPDSCNWMDN